MIDLFIKYLLYLCADNLNLTERQSSFGTQNVIG